MKIIFLTGAGISAESGISTFRDKNGLWDNYDIEKICNYSSWKKNRSLVFKFYNQRRTQLEFLSPNIIHKSISSLQHLYSNNDNIEIISLTQNIDDLFEKANSLNTIHLHGYLTRMLCTACSKEWDIRYEIQNEMTIRCPKCNSNKGVKPHVIFFGEKAPEYLKLNKYFKNITSSDLVIVLGTSGFVIDINTLLKSKKCLSILNNLEASSFINDKLFSHVFYENGSSAIPKIIDIIKANINNTFDKM